jgi:hypothetical protein
MGMRPILPALGLLVGLAFAGLHCAYADVPPPRTSDGPVLDRPPPAAFPRIEIVDEWAQALPAYDQGGRRYVLGETGERYQVRIVNPTASRVEAVVSVDGLDAVDGRPANLNKRGYIVPAYGGVTIDGFRTSLDTVAAFRFSSVRDSYAARTHHPRNVGVVGVAFFAERPRPVVHDPPPRPMTSRAASAPPAEYAEQTPAPATPNAAPKAAGGAAPSAARPGLGTQFGETRESRVVETTFVRASASPTAMSELRYDDRDGLLSRGISLDPPARDPRAAENELRDTAQAFPESRFAQPPR